MIEDALQVLAINAMHFPLVGSFIYQEEFLDVFSQCLLSHLVNLSREESHVLGPCRMP